MGELHDQSGKIDDNQDQHDDALTNYSSFILKAESILCEIEVVLMSNGHNLGSYSLIEGVKYYCAIQDIKIRDAKLAANLLLMTAGTLLSSVFKSDKDKDNKFTRWLSDI